MPALESVIHLLSTYRYLILLPLAIIEGPIITIVAGFFVTLGIFNPVWVYLITVAGDIIGDSALYGLGRWGGKTTLNRVGKYFGTSSEKIEKTKLFFKEHGRKAVALSKITHGIGMAGLIAAGSLDIPYWRFARVCFSVTLVQAAVFLVIGLIFGHAYVQISKYLNYFAGIVSIIVLAAILFAIFYKLKISSSR